MANKNLSGKVSAAKVVTRSGSAPLCRVKEYLNFLADTLMEADVAECTGKATVRDGQVKVLFNISNLQLQVVVKQEGIGYECAE